MGFLDRLFGGRAKTAEETRFPGEKMVVKAPMDGIVLPLEQLPDETFAAAILGPGCGIEPTGSTVYAPFDGKITSIVPTLHAVGLESTEGIELLIHIGMDTIALRGSGFTPLVREGQAVKAGTPLLNVDLDAIRAAGLSTESAVIVTNACQSSISSRAASSPPARRCSNSSKIQKRHLPSADVFFVMLMLFRAYTAGPARRRGR